VCRRLVANLAKLDLVHGLDYWVHGRDVLHHYSSLEMRSHDQITACLLVACNATISKENEWGIIIGVRDQKTNKLLSIVETSGEMFTVVRGGGGLREAIFEAYRKMGLGDRLSWKP
jgi:hypothetical protein